MSNKLTRLVREPLIQFLLIGGYIYGAYALFGAPQTDDGATTIVVDTARVQGFISQWGQRWNRPPTRQEIDGVIQAFVRDEILYRQALAMGLGEDDPVTRRRLAQKLEFLTSDLALLKEPAGGELEQYFEDNQERYRAADLMTFSHVFFDPDQRDDTTLDDAAEVLAQLQAAGAPDEARLDVGDRFMLQSYYPEATELDIQRAFGTGFAASVMKLEPQRWHGPVLSGYGVHLVYVYEFREAPSPRFEDAGQAVLQDWQAEQQEEFNAAFFESLKSRYEVVIAEVPVELILDTGADDGDDPRSGEPTAIEAEPAS